MKKLFFICTLLFALFYQSFSQNKSFIAAEVSGNGGFYSLSYLREMKNLGNGNFFSLRSGLSVMPRGGYNLASSVDVFLPLSSHYTLGKHWELGLALTPYLRFKSFEDAGISEKTRTFDVVSFTGVGYRTDMGDKWLFKASLSAGWYIGRPLNEIFPWPGIMFARRIK